MQILIFIVLFVLGFLFFSPEEGGGPIGGFFVVTENILQLHLISEGNQAVGMILSFIITTAVYLIVAQIITWLLISFFGKKN